MPSINRYIAKDASGNTLHVQTHAEVVICDTNSNVQAALDAIRASISGQTVMHVVADIAARDALTGLKVGDQCWVIDASADATVGSGAAKYIVQSMTGTTPSWVKTAEAESMDLTIDWSDIQNKPSSTVAEIDAAVAYHKDLTATAAEVNAAVTYHKALTATAAEVNTAADYVGDLTHTAAQVDEACDATEVAIIANGGAVPSTLKTNGIYFEAMPSA